MRRTRVYYYLAFIFTVILFVTLFYYCRNGTKVVQYEDMEDIIVAYHTKESDVAKITIESTYVKDGETYYDFTTSVSGNSVYTFSQAEYNDTFGEGNTAVDCEVYKLKLEADVIGYKSLLRSRIDNVDIVKMVDYMDNPYGFEYTYSYPFTYYDTMCHLFSASKMNTSSSYSCYSINNYASLREDLLAVGLLEYRYSFLGEKDFTDEEIIERKENVDKLSRYVLEAFLDY